MGEPLLSVQYVFNMKKKLMLTGATGFLGSHFAARIYPCNYQTHLFSRHADPARNIHTMDLTVFSSVQKIVVDIEPDVIVHLGGLVNLTRDFEVAKKCIDSNILGTLNLLEATRGHAPKLFIYVSTEEVYGNSPIPYKEETSLTHPPSPYAMTKLAGEHLCDMYGRYLGFPVVILRIGTMYGPGDSVKRFIPGIITRAIRNEDILLNSGKKARDYVFVEDAIDALMACLGRQNQVGTMVVNIGGGRPYTLRVVVQKIIALCHSTSVIHFNALPDRMLESDIWHMDITNARKVLGWTPKTSLTGGLGQAIRYYRGCMT